MIEKFNSWCDKKANIKRVYFLIFTLLAMRTIKLLICNTDDMDMYFLISTGRKIIREGLMPHNMFWAIDKDSHTVIQQWLYCVLIAYADKWGMAGRIIFIAIQLMLLYALNIVFNKGKVKKADNFILSAAVILLNYFYLFKNRPETISTILLILQCIVFERYREKRKWITLICLPIIMIAEINFHASVWIIHVAVSLAYAIDLTKVIKRKKSAVDWGIMTSTALSVPFMLLNPNGMEAVGYLFNSMKAHTFDMITVTEVVIPSLLSFHTFMLLAAVVMALWAYKNHSLNPVTLNMVIGFGMLQFVAVRNIQYLYFPFLFLARDIYTVAREKWLKSAYTIRNDMMCLLMIGNVAVILLTVSSISDVTFEKKTVESLKPIMEYITDKDARIYTGFNIGSYFEYSGCTNIYLDARPELATKEFTKGKEILRDYAKFVSYGFDPITGTPVTKEEFDEWFHGYDFDFLVVTNRYDTFLLAQMMINNDYRLVDDLSTDTYNFYEKVN